MAAANESFALGFADCFESLHRQGDAEDIYRALIRGDPLNVQGRLKLARLYERTDCKEQALVILKEVMGLGRKDAIRQAKLPMPPSVRKPGRRRVEKPVRPKLSKQEKAKEATLSEHLSISALQQESAPSPSRAGVDARVTSTEPPTTRVAHASQTPDVPRNAMLSTCNRLKELWHVVEGEADASAIEEWMHVATTALHEFRRERAFFGRDKPFAGYGKHPSGRLAEDVKYAKAEQEALKTLRRLEPEVRHADPSRVAEEPNSQLPTTYYGILFGDWHRLIVTLALLYADRGDQAHCYDLLREVLMKASVYYYDDAFAAASLAAALHCALRFNDSAYAMELARDCAAKTDLRASVPYQLIAATTRMCHGTDNEFYTHATKAFMARAVKLMDYNVMPAPLRQRIDFGVQTPSLVSRLAKYGQEENLTPDAGVLTIYGNTMAISSHFTSALPYYLRALALEPENFSINLSIGLTYVHQAMKRQTENRHYGIQQGLGFLQRYYDLRVASGKAGHAQEAEFNRARTWDVLGLTHLAIPGYEKVLAMSELVQAEAEAGPTVPEGDEVEDFAKEAAFALQRIFAVAGNEEAAVAIAEQWLVM
ncbi:hypothetical protein B0A55_13429 [Friedmanniomyces simplex]|uniref:Uncharacterized protein n=1 Tax=Friedmanniomyces simplex TaxID=329884 RepID=A0A4U0W0X0_9PEZI|nr:hypothetical protein B0A55_13429 [Friedmanniomyces simplex]